MNKDYDRARRYIHVYERELGLFDDKGNIEVGREFYYYNKGLYYMGIQCADSAEYYFRRLLVYHYYYEAYKGLFSLYQSTNNVDSIVKYASLYEDALLQGVTNRQAEAIIQSSAMYRYERNQNAAMLNEQRAVVLKLISIFIAIISVLVLSFIYRYFRNRSIEQERELHQLQDDFINALTEHGRLVEECEILQRTIALNKMSDEAQTLVKKKQERIERLEQLLEEYKSSINMLEYAKREKLLKESEIVKYFASKTIPTPNWKSPRPERWMEISKIYKEYMPLASAYIDRAKLSRQEYYTCILTHLGFAPGDIAILLDTTSSRISNAKHSAVEKLFGKNAYVRLGEGLIDIECKAHVE